MASAERESIRESGGGAHSGVQARAEPLVRGSGGEAPLKLKGFWALYVERTGNICPFTQLLKALKYLPNIAYNKVRVLRYTKRHTHTHTHTHYVCVNDTIRYEMLF